MYWGEVSEYDKSWREYAERNPNVDIVFFKFEDFLKNKARVRLTIVTLWFHLISTL